MNHNFADEEIKGKFYEEELTLYDNVTQEFKIDKVLKKRTRKGVKELLFKWYGCRNRYEMLNIKELS
uniref:Chromo domain-containing protein n=1 Tax=Caenorhabditis tropicalis TaxID=1561998 RepID=A0A1I7V4X4_9PELO